MIEQAKQLAQRLRNHAYMTDYLPASNAADTIDALVAEVERLKETFRKDAAEFDRVNMMLKDTNASFHAEVELLKSSQELLIKQSDKMISERENIRAEVERLSAKAADFEDRWYKVCDVANDLRAQLRTYQEREKTMGWNQS